MLKLKEKRKKQKSFLISKPNTFYDSFWISKFINKFMLNGRKKIVENNVYKAFSNVKRITSENPGLLLLKSMDILRPVVGTTKHIKRKGKKRRRRKIILVPVPLHLRRQLVMSLSWICELVLHQKRLRHIHRHLKLKNPKPNDPKYRLAQIKPRRKHNYGRSRKKIFSNRFYIALKDQRLHMLILRKFEEIFSTKFGYLTRRKHSFYVQAVKNGKFIGFRWA